MKLLKLVDGLSCKFVNFKNVKITNLSLKASELEKNGLFFAINGNNHNGENYANEAVKNGAVVVVTAKKLELSENVVQVLVEDVRCAMAIISRNFYNRADEKLKIIQLIGTNGKTTTATITYDILRSAGKKVGLIGTNGIKINGLNLPSFLTTPDPIDLHYVFNQMVQFGVEYCVMEVSAQSIYYNKVDGIKPYMICYTNITPEHLDFFGTMECYAKTKIDYILSQNQAIVVTNSDDEYGRKLLQISGVKSYGLFNPSDVFAIDINMSLKNCNFVCNAFDDVFNIDSAFTGEYNVYNLLASITMAKSIGISTLNIQNAIKNIKNVAGRWEVFDFKNNNKVIVDYAHTPDGFDKVLSLVKSLRKGRIIVLFGCVGYSDSLKRKQMGDVVKKYGDFAIITSDNFSDDNFDKMFNDIGINKYYAKIENRAKAVEFGINMLDKNDTLILLGKGAEIIQKTTDGDIEYNELELVKNYQKRESVG